MTEFKLTPSRYSFKLVASISKSTNLPLCQLQLGYKPEKKINNLFKMPKDILILYL